MGEFLNLKSSSEALEIFLNSVGNSTIEHEEISTSQGLGRVNAENIYAPQDLPLYPKSTVDGYVVRSRDTFGASDSLPAYLTFRGEIRMGENVEFDLISGDTYLIHTGGMLPRQADAVVMIENSQLVNDRVVEIRKSAAVGENVIAYGEELSKGELILSEGETFHPVDLGCLLSIGIQKVKLIKKPIVGIISSGDEIVDPAIEVPFGKVRDVNSSLLAALIIGWGGQPINYGISLDKYDDLMNFAEKAHKECNVVVFTAGSSVSSRDITEKVISSLGLPGILVHGVNIKPGKPTILAYCSKKPVLGLPGNPGSAFVTANIFLRPLLFHLQKRKTKTFNHVKAISITNLASQTGREDWVPVRLEKKNDLFNATPVFGRSNFIFSLVKADGMIYIPSEKTGIAKGEIVDVELIRAG